MFKPFDNFFKQNTEAEQEVLKLLTSSGYAQRLRAEKDAARVEKQKALLPKLEDVRQRREKEIPELRAKLAKAQAAENKAAETLKDLRSKRIQAADEEYQRSWQLDFEEGKIESEIRSHAPDCIDEFRAELGRLEIETRNDVKTEIRPTKKNYLTDSFGHRFSSNVKAVEKRLEAIRSARKEAEALKMEALSESEIIARLEALKAGLPTADEYETTVVPVPDAAELRRVG